MESHNRIHTTKFLKAQAKKVSRQTGIPHHEALDKVVQEVGFANWPHYLNKKALVSDLSSASPSRIVLRPEHLLSYLPNYNDLRYEDFPDLVTSKERAVSLLEEAKKRIPKLTHFGIGIFGERGEVKKQGAEAVSSTIAEMRSKWADYMHEVAACVDWLDTANRIKSLNKRHSSYGYKHLVQSWCQSRVERGEVVPTYIANGSFIAAAVGMGFSFEPEGPNAYFNISEKSVKAAA